MQSVLFWGRSHKAFRKLYLLSLWSCGLASDLGFLFGAGVRVYGEDPSPSVFTPGLWEDCPRLARMVIYRTAPLSTVAYADSASLCKWPLPCRGAVRLHSAVWVRLLPEPARSPLLVVLSCPGLRCRPRCLVSPGEPLTVCSCFLNTSLSPALNSVELGLNLCLLGSFCCL